MADRSNLKSYYDGNRDGKAGQLKPGEFYSQWGEKIRKPAKVQQEVSSSSRSGGSEKTYKQINDSLHSVSPGSARGDFLTAVREQGGRPEYKSPTAAMMYERRHPQGMIQGHTKSEAHVGSGVTSVEAKPRNETLNSLGYWGIANHEAEHARHQSPTRGNVEIAPSVGDIVFRGKQFQMENGKPLDHTVKLPGDVSHDIDWMVKTANEHGYFSGASMQKLLETTEGRQWLARMRGKAPGTQSPEQSQATANSMPELNDLLGDQVTSGESPSPSAPSLPVIKVSDLAAYGNPPPNDTLSPRTPPPPDVQRNNSVAEAPEMGINTPKTNIQDLYRKRPRPYGEEEQERLNESEAQKYGANEMNKKPIRPSLASEATRSQVESLYGRPPSAPMSPGAAPHLPQRALGQSPDAYQAPSVSRSGASPQGPVPQGPVPNVPLPYEERVQQEINANQERMYGGGPQAGNRASKPQERALERSQIPVSSPTALPTVDPNEAYKRAYGADAQPPQPIGQPASQQAQVPPDPASQFSMRAGMLPETYVRGTEAYQMDNNMVPPRVQGTERSQLTQQQANQLSESRKQTEAANALRERMGGAEGFNKLVDQFADQPADPKDIQAAKDRYLRDNGPSMGQQTDRLNQQADRMKSANDETDKRVSDVVAGKLLPSPRDPVEEYNSNRNAAAMDNLHQIYKERNAPPPINKEAAKNLRKDVTTSPYYNDLTRNISEHGSLSTGGQTTEETARKDMATLTTQYNIYRRGSRDLPPSQVMNFREFTDAYYKDQKDPAITAGKDAAYADRQAEISERDKVKEQYRERRVDMASRQGMVSQEAARLIRFGYSPAEANAIAGSTVSGAYAPIQPAIKDVDPQKSIELLNQFATLNASNAYKDVYRQAMAEGLGTTKAHEEGLIASSEVERRRNYMEKAHPELAGMMPREAPPDWSKGEPKAKRDFDADPNAPEYADKHQLLAAYRALKKNGVEPTKENIESFLKDKYGIGVPPEDMVTTDGVFTDNDGWWRGDYMLWPEKKSEYKDRADLFKNIYGKEPPAKSPSKPSSQSGLGTNSPQVK
jgi:hypothetical protein